MIVSLGESPASRDGAPNRAGETLTQLLARIFDQLSISSWLPSVFVVTAAVFYGNLAGNDGSIEETFDSVAHMGAGPIALLVGAVVLTTVLTQAFEFEAIRVLEGSRPDRPPHRAQDDTCAGGLRRAGRGICTDACERPDCRARILRRESVTARVPQSRSPRRALRRGTH
jgi:hypothetical protein